MANQKNRLQSLMVARKPNIQTKLLQNIDHKVRKDGTGDSFFSESVSKFLISTKLYIIYCPGPNPTKVKLQSTKF